MKLTAIGFNKLNCVLLLLCTVIITYAIILYTL